MKKLISIVFVVIVFFVFSQQSQAQHKIKGNGNVVKTQVQMPAFSGINAKGTDNILITTRGVAYSVTTETDENLQGKVKMKIKNGLLNFSYSNLNPKKLRFYISVPSIATLIASGASDVKSTDTLSGNKLMLNISGAANVSLLARYNKIIVKTSGAADVKLVGKTAELRINSSGAADVKAGGLVADSVFAKSSGASTVHVNPVYYLKKNKSGVADIKISTRRKKIVSVEINKKQERVEVSTGKKIFTQPYPDTTTVKVGSLKVEVVDGDTTKITIGSHALIVDNNGNVKWERYKSRRFNGHWGGVEIGINGYVNSHYNDDFGKAYDYLDLRYEKSINVNLNIFEQNFSLNKAKSLGIVTGLGFSFNNYSFSTPTYLSPDSIVLRGYYMRNVNVKTSKLTAMYLTIPLFLEIQTLRSKHRGRFHVAIGMLLNARISSHTKIYFNEANQQYYLQDPATSLKLSNYYTTPNRTDRNIVKSFNSFSLNPFRFDASVRIGYGFINLYATYALNPMFQKNRGPELNQWSVGITLVGW